MTISGFKFSPAALTAASLLGAGVASASQDTYVTVVLDKGTSPGLVAGSRTSDIGASFVKCTISGSSLTCSVKNSNSSTKNIGNILCLPAAGAAYKLSDRCASLIRPGSGSCQTNSASSQCGGGTTSVFPVCNYRTSATSSTTANWVWNVGVDASGYGIDCLQAGYQGPNPK